MNLSFLDSYCERAGAAEIWAEPLNTLTNIAFILAAWLVFKAVRKLPLRHFPEGYMLCALLACIGVGSGLWHLYPNSLTVMLDVLPITAFIYVALGALLMRSFAWRWWGMLAGVVALTGFNALAGVVFNPDTLHGTIMYLPTYAMLVALVALAYTQKRDFARELAIITFIWTASLIFRTVDIPLCAALPMGTHFLWHSFNAVVLYRLIQLITRQRQ
jgi:Ceramidase